MILFGPGSKTKKILCLTLHHLGSNFSLVVIGLNRGVSSKFLTIIEFGVLPDVNNSFSTLVTIAVSPSYSGLGVSVELHFAVTFEILRIPTELILIVN